jgi:hypothetical protein
LKNNKLVQWAGEYILWVVWKMQPSQQKFSNFSFFKKKNAINISLKSRLKLSFDDLSWFFVIFKSFFVTSWCSGRLIGSSRQRSRVQDPISTINISFRCDFSSFTICFTVLALGCLFIVFKLNIFFTFYILFIFTDISPQQKSIIFGTQFKPWTFTCIFLEFKNKNHQNHLNSLLSRATQHLKKIKLFGIESPLETWGLAALKIAMRKFSRNWWTWKLILLFSVSFWKLFVYYLLALKSVWHLQKTNFIFLKSSIYLSKAFTSHSN